MAEKLVKIDNCIYCPNFRDAGEDSCDRSFYCSVTGLALDGWKPFGFIPSWCPLEDASENTTP